MSAQKPLKRGTLNCPACHETLHFEVKGQMRVVRDGALTARCQTCKVFYKVEPNEQHN